jgi:hypothetical protein
MANRRSLGITLTGVFLIGWGVIQFTGLIPGLTLLLGGLAVVAGVCLLVGR